MFSMLVAAVAVGDESSEKVPMFELELGEPDKKPLAVEPLEAAFALSLREAMEEFMEVAEVG